MIGGGGREFDHTGDLGFEVEGADPADLFARAAGALAALLYDPAVVRDRDTIGFSIRGRDLSDLLVRFLGEIVSLFGAVGMQFRRFEVDRLEATVLRATGRGERFDAARHRPRHGIKAVTYHQARVEPCPGGAWRASPCSTRSRAGPSGHSTCTSTGGCSSLGPRPRR